MLIEDEYLLAQIAAIDPITVDGMMGLINLGETFQAVYFRWRAARMDGGMLLKEKMPVAVLRCPRSYVTAGSNLDHWLSMQLSGQIMIKERPH